MNYSEYLSTISALVVVPQADPSFTNMINGMVNDAEQRLYRELDLLNTIVRDSSSTFTTSTPVFNLPSTNGTFVTVESIYAISPAGSSPDSGTRNVLLPASRAYITMCFPSSSGSSIPQYFAPTTQSSFIVGPWPSAAYVAEVVGTVRPAAIGTTNTTTLLSVYFPDLFVAASMVYAAGYLQNYGAVVDNPQQGITWETHYKNLMGSAQVEEARKKFTSEGWSSKQPAPLATPPRN